MKDRQMCVIKGKGEVMGARKVEVCMMLRRAEKNGRE
jgi:hypothetical protein